MKLLVRLEGPGAEYGGLLWEHDGACYPHAAHRDFTPDVLAQWTVTMRDLLRGAERVTLEYVEGGHALDVSRVDGDECVAMPRAVEPPVAWPASARALATMVCEAAALVAARLPEPHALARDVETLRAALQHAKEVDN